MQLPKTTVLIEATGLTSAAQMDEVFAQARSYFAEFGEPVPPLPDDAAPYVGCNVLVTETKDEDGARTGKVTLTGKDGSVRFERGWSIQGQRRR